MEQFGAGAKATGLYLGESVNPELCEIGISMSFAAHWLLWCLLHPLQAFFVMYTTTVPTAIYPCV